MATPSFTMRQLLEAGVHYGHHTRRWNPKMSPYIFGIRNGVHILDLQQTVPMLHHAMEAIRNTVASGGRVLFVGTKTQASERIKESAKRCGQYYINHRWLGGTMTNWKTVNQSIKRMKEMEERLSQASGLTKKESLDLERSFNKLDMALGGIREMGGLPDILFVIDTNKEAIAIQEARRLNIPVVAVLDSNSDPEGVTFPIPGNDDALRAIGLYCELISGAVLAGLQAEMSSAGIDLGESAEVPTEVLEPEIAIETLAEEFGAEAPAEASPEIKTAKGKDKAESPAEPKEDSTPE
ncbi:MAG: 30S ribosomal protein S2 [Alphaproteobacteria bacterium]|jgi:small subunit ribosomal protein S2|nr:30S ribosomal protein S2 [Alphaproteobacteria bacterium]